MQAFTAGEIQLATPNGIPLELESETQPPHAQIFLNGCFWMVEVKPDGSQPLLTKCRTQNKAEAFRTFRSHCRQLGLKLMETKP